MSHASTADRIGPNAIIQVATALDRLCGRPVTDRVFRAAAVDRYLLSPPNAMVPEAEVIALHAALRAQLAPPALESIAAAAGRTTADYLLANRIPRIAQVVLQRLPRRAAGKLLLKAIARNAWTFAGTGHVTTTADRVFSIRIANSPLCRGVRSATPTCEYYRATFERLFRVLVVADAQVVEIECESTGAPACRFDIYLD